MSENLTVLSISSIIGFAITFLTLEAVWHFTACRLHNTTVKPCVFKQVKTMIVSAVGPDSKRWWWWKV